jgi:hypothetical protein
MGYHFATERQSEMKMQLTWEKTSGRGFQVGYECK